MGLWEASQLRCLAEQSYLMLGAALPEAGAAQLLSLPLGRRDGYLLQLRELTAGSKIEGYAECVRCRERLTFTLNTGDILLRDPAIESETEFVLDIESCRVWFRLVTLGDLLAIRECPSVEAGRSILVERCITRVERDGAPVPSRVLSDAAIERVGEAIREADPQVEIRFQISCPNCGHDWSSTFDIVSFFWKELSIRAQRLFREVDTLARAYGWTESEILHMSLEKRRHYLELAG